MEKEETTEGGDSFLSIIFIPQNPAIFSIFSLN
jgi:hypothetical protein